ncbi:phosphatase PAP2 family protein [Candidatus Micrarchaeota archaeon]|nr:phosphatase PAP2 family protein [Candidatus Micrarchaeota archaeon]
METDLIYLASKLVDDQFYLLITLFVFVGLFKFKRRDVFLLSLLLTLLFIPVLKDLYKIPRPCAGETYCPSSYGFPSIHSAVSFVFIFGALGTPLFFIILPLGALVSFSRIYLGVHSLSQVAAGATVGMVIYLLVWIFINRFRKHFSLGEEW